MSGLVNSIDVSASGLTIQRRKMDAIAQNIANVETTRTEDGSPYRRKRVMVEEARENVPFKTIMNQARTRLARTNPGHLPGSTRNLKSGVEISKVDAKEVEASPDDYKLIYDPAHPDADEEGYVKMPDVELINEMVDMMTSSRAYEANTTAILAAKEMARNAMEI